MEERSMFPPLGIGPQVLLCRMSDVPADAAIRVASQMRSQGLRVEIYADSANMGKMLTYANTIGAPFAAILGTGVGGGIAAFGRVISGPNRPAAC